MGRAPCCDEKLGLKKGPWTPDEDQKLVSHIRQHGHGSWRALPEKAGLKRCGKSCRLRWTNYLRPDIKRGRFSFEEDRIIVQLHAILGNRWSAIASHLPRRTDNEIKNYWNTHLKKRLTQMGIDPITHQKTSSQAGGTNLPPTLTTPPWTPLPSTQLTHMTQWDLALAEAEARLARHTNPFLKPFTTSPQSVRLPPTTHPSAFFMRSWKTKVEDTLKPKFRPVKLEPQFKILQDWGSASPLLPNNSGAMADMVLGAALSSCVSTSMTKDDSEIFLPSDHLYGLSGERPSDNISPGSVSGHFQNQSITESPSSVLHGPDSDATSPCGSSTSDCFDLILHQSSSCFQNFPAISGNADQEPRDLLDTFWQRQQSAMEEAMRPDSVIGDHTGGGSSECGLELVVPLDFNSAEFPQFEILCQGEQFQADCVLEC